MKKIIATSVISLLLAGCAQTHSTSMEQLTEKKVTFDKCVMAMNNGDGVYRETNDVVTVYNSPSSFSYVVLGGNHVDHYSSQNMVKGGLDFKDTKNTMSNVYIGKVGDTMSVRYYDLKDNKAIFKDLIVSPSNIAGWNAAKSGVTITCDPTHASF